MRVEEDGKSEGRAVTARIAVWDMAAPERVADFRLVFHREMNGLISTVVRGDRLEKGGPIGPPYPVHIFG